MSSEESKKQKSFGAKLNDFLCSIKLSIFVLGALATTSIIGTVVEQGQPANVYVERHGEVLGKIMNLLNFGDMYHSWWFQILMGLLMLNITFCSIRRFPHALKLMKDKDPVIDGRPVALHQKTTMSFDGLDSEEAAARGAEALQAKFSQPLRQESDGKVYLMASKGAWSRMGVYVTHFSLFLFAIGSLVGLWTGFKGYVNIPEGSTVSQVRLRPTGQMLDLGFEVRCDHFEVSFYKDKMGRDTRRPKDYISDLTVLKDGKELYSKRIEVNDPLIHEGVFFYQSSYGPGGAKGAWVSVLGPDRKLLLKRKYVTNNGMANLEEGIRIKLLDATGDYQNMGPAAMFTLVGEGQGKSRTTVYQASMGNMRKLGKYTVRLEGVDSIMYTGLQVAKDPGVPIVWAGCILITLGLLASFFFSHRRVWIRIAPTDKGVEVYMAGNASRNRISFENQFEDLSSFLKESFEK